MKKLASWLCALGLGFAVVASVNAATSEEKIIQRIQAVGSVCLEGDDSCGGAAAAAVASGPRSGEEVYKAACVACHGLGVAGAPKFGDAEWNVRAAKGMDTLMANAINGINAMPARGTCMNCSDEEIQVAIEYMINSAP
ncbi:MAG: c-type cytochrome [Pontibacterium sp.]